MFKLRIFWEDISKESEHIPFNSIDACKKYAHWMMDCDLIWKETDRMFYTYCDVCSFEIFKK